MTVLKRLPFDTTLEEALERIEDLVIQGHKGATLDIENYAIGED